MLQQDAAIEHGGLAGADPGPVLRDLRLVIAGEGPVIGLDPGVDPVDAGDVPIGKAFDVVGLQARGFGHSSTPSLMTTAAPPMRAETSAPCATVNSSVICEGRPIS